MLLSIRTKAKYNHSLIKRNLNLFMKNSNTKKLIFAPFSEAFRDRPAYIEKEIENLKVLKEQIYNRIEESKINNASYQQFLKVNQKLKIDYSYLKSFDLDTLIEEVNQHEEKKINLEYPALKNEEARTFVDNINKLINVEFNRTTLDPFKQNLNSLLNLLQEEFLNTPEKVHLLFDEYVRIINFLKLIPVDKTSELHFIQMTLNKYFSLLNSLPELTIDIVKQNENFLFETLENIYHQRNKNGELINVNEFNATLRKTLENCIVTLTKYTGDKSVDLGNFYTLLSLYYLKDRQYEKSEEYSLRSLEIFNTSYENKKDLSFMQPYYILGEVYISHYSDIKQAYVILNEGLNIIKSSGNLTPLCEKFEVFKFKMVNKLVTIYSFVEKEHIKKELDLIDFYLRNANMSLLVKYPNVLSSALKMMSRGAELYSDLKLSRKSYEIYKHIYQITSASNPNYSENLDKLISLFEYSDDFNTNLNYLNYNKENVSNDLAEYRKELINFLMTLLVHSAKSKNFNMAKKIIDIIENNVLKKTEKVDLNHEALVNFYTTATFVKKNVNQIEASLSDLNRAIGLLSATTDETRLKLVKCLFNSAYLHTLLDQRNYAIENYEICIKILKEDETHIKENSDFLVSLHFYLCNLYLLNNEKTKVALQLANLNDLIKNFYTNDDKVKVFYQYVDELQKEINK